MRVRRGGEAEWERKERAQGGKETGSEAERLKGELWKARVCVCNCVNPGLRLNNSSGRQVSLLENHCLHTHTHKHTASVHRNTLDTSGVSHVPDCDCIINRMLMMFRAAVLQVRGRSCSVKMSHIDLQD